MAERSDYYDVLGVPREASPEDIRNAYRRLARQYHPDVNKTAEAGERFKEANEAYQVLSDADRRRAYDRFGHAGVQEGNGFEGFAGFGDLGDIFGDLFGFGMRSSGRSQRAPQRGADLQYGLKIGFREAAFGATKTLELSRLQTCERCAGSGAEPGTSPMRCPTCNGSGEVRRVQQTILGSFVNVGVCPNCGGRGEVVGTRCTECGGERQVRRTRSLEIQVPQGVDTGTRMRLTGEGDAGMNGGPAGNLYVTFEVEPDAVFRRQEDDLIYELPLNVTQAALGATVAAPTLEGEEMLKVPAGTQSGRVFRLKGRGIARLQRGGRGDEIVVVRVITPTNLTARQKDLLAELAETLGEENGPQDEPNFIERMKNVLGI